MEKYNRYYKIALFLINTDGLEIEYRDPEISIVDLRRLKDMNRKSSLKEEKRMTNRHVK